MTVRTIYAYHVNLDERGDFRADVRDRQGKTVFEIEAPAQSEDQSTIFDDGYMKDKHDLDGLTEYLRELGIIPADGEVMEASKAEPLFDVINSLSKEVASALGRNEAFHRQVAATNFTVSVDEDNEPYVQFEVSNAKQSRTITLVTLSRTDEYFDAEFGQLHYSDHGVPCYWCFEDLRDLTPETLGGALISVLEAADKSAAIKLEGHIRASFAEVLAGDGPRVAVPGMDGVPLAGLRLESGAALELAKTNYLIEHAEDYAEGDTPEDFASINYMAHPVWLVSDTDDLERPLPFDTVAELFASDVIRPYLEDARAEDALASLDEDTPAPLARSAAPGV